MSDDLPYERLISVMDTILKAGFTSIAVLPGSPK
jgi:biopolymer transport protein ExbD